MGRPRAPLNGPEVTAPGIAEQENPGSRAGAGVRDANALCAFSFRAATNTRSGGARGQAIARRPSQIRKLVAQQHDERVARTAGSMTDRNEAATTDRKVWSASSTS